MPAAAGQGPKRARRAWRGRPPAVKLYPMLSAIVVCPGPRTAPLAGQEALVRSLAPLVGACIAGVVRDVVLAGPQGLDLAAIADHAGCDWVAGANEAEWLANGIRRARRPHLFVLRAGFVPEAGFIEEIEDAAGLLPATRLVMRARPVRFAERLAPRLAPVAAVVMPAAGYRSGTGFDALASGRGPTRLLRSRARPAV